MPKPFSRKITENTEQTKAESINKISDKDSRFSKSKIKFGMFELESFPSGNILQTKSESRYNSKSHSPRKIKENSKIQASSSGESKSDPDSKHVSELENSELKQTADFFRPSDEAYLKDTAKRLSFGRKGKKIINNKLEQSSSKYSNKFYFA